MFAALSKAFVQLPEQTLRNSVIWSVLGALAMILASGFMSGWLVSQIQGFGIEWLDSLLGALGGGLVMVLAFMFYPATVMVVAGFFFAIQSLLLTSLRRHHWSRIPSARCLVGPFTRVLRLYHRSQRLQRTSSPHSWLGLSSEPAQRLLVNGSYFELRWLLQCCLV